MCKFGPSHIICSHTQVDKCRLVLPLHHHLFDHTPQKNLKLSKTDLTKLFSIATSQTHFLFDGKVYNQIDGVAMGSPLAPVLAILFLGHYENIWPNNYQGPNVHFC